MRHLTAVEVDLGEGGKGWHYASASRRGGHPLGYCAEHPPHPTEDDARRCYQTYRRDHVRLDDDRSCSWTSCMAIRDGRLFCDNPARKVADIEGCGYSFASLCDEHYTRDDAITALHLDGDLAGDAWQS